MFERYTEKARRTIFFARYEASQAGSQYIECEHLLLGLLREDRAAAAKILGTTSLEMVARELVKPVGAKVSTSVDLPLSHPSKRSLAYGAEEAQRLGHEHIGTGHLLLGLLLEGSRAATFLREHGADLETMRAYVKDAVAEEAAPAGLKERVKKMLQGVVDKFTSEGDFKDGRFSQSRVEGGARLVKSLNYVGGNRIQVVERMHLSEDGKTLHYAIEIQGPGQQHRHEVDFEVGTSEAAGDAPPAQS